MRKASTDELSQRQIILYGGCAFIALLFLILSLRCYKTIEPGNVGLVTRFGGLTGTVLTEGLNFKLPFDSVDLMDIKINQIVILPHRLSIQMSKSMLSVKPRR